MNIITITLQKRIMMGALKSEQLISIFVSNGSYTRTTDPLAGAIHKQQVWVGKHHSAGPNAAASA